MPNLPISRLPQSAELQGDELFADVQGGVTKYTTLDQVNNYVTSSINNYNQTNTGNTYLVPVFITIAGASSSPYPEYYVTGSTYENTSMIDVNWSGGNGEAHIVLPDATSETSTYRSIRFVMGGQFESNTKAVLMAPPGQYLDNDLYPDGYTLDKAYEGIMVWSDGTRWIRIQTKA